MRIKNQLTIWMSVAVLAVSCISAYAQFDDVFNGTKDPNSGPTVITSDKMEFDYKDFIALFDGNVVVTDAQFVMQSDKMLVFFENTNEVKRVDAVGNVYLKSGDMTARCGKATYTSSNAQVLIQNDNPLVTKGENRITGEKMSIWLNEQRVVVETGVKLEASHASAKNADTKSKK